MIDIFLLEKEIVKVEAKDLEKNKSKKIWIDLTNITKEERDLVQNTLALHPLTTEDLFNANVSIKIEEFDEYLFCVFYGILNNLEAVEIDFIIGENFILTNHKKEIESFKALKNDTTRLEKVFKKGNDFLFHRLLDLEVDNFFPVLETIDEKIEKLEEKVSTKPKPELLKSILKLKRQIVSIKRFSLPQREKISTIAKGEYKFVSDACIPYMRDVYDHAIKVADTIDNLREATSNAFDIYMSAVSNNMNEVMKILSIIATIALPLTVISGIYGTNFDILPGQHNIYGFWIMIGFMALLAIFMMYLFKKRKWF